MQRLARLPQHRMRRSAFIIIIIIIFDEFIPRTGYSCGSCGFRRGPDDGHNHRQGATSSTSRGIATRLPDRGRPSDERHGLRGVFHGTVVKVGQFLAPRSHHLGGTHIARGEAFLGCKDPQEVGFGVVRRDGALTDVVMTSAN